MAVIDTSEHQPPDEPGPWWVGIVDDGDVHVVPVGDLKPHDDTCCHCCPALEVNADDVDFRGVLIHNSFDHRELLEGMPRT